MKAWEKNRAEAQKAMAQGKAAEAATFLKAALGEAEKFDAKDYRLAESLSDLGNFRTTTGDFASAEPLFAGRLPFAVATRTAWPKLNACWRLETLAGICLSTTRRRSVCSRQGKLWIQRWGAVIPLLPSAGSSSRGSFKNSESMWRLRRFSKPWNCFATHRPKSSSRSRIPRLMDLM